MDSSTIQLISIIVSAILGLGGIVIAGLSAYWARAERIEPLKRHLYEQQTLGASECVESLVRLQLLVENHHSSINYPEFFEDDDQRITFIDSTQEAREEFKSKLYRWSHVLPNEVFAPMTHYLSVVEYVSNKREVFFGWAGCSYPFASPWTVLPGLFLEAIASVREFLGIDPLSAKLTETIGMTEEERKKKVAEKTETLGYLMSHDYRPYRFYQDGYLLTPGHSVSGSPDDDQV